MSGNVISLADRMKKYEEASRTMLPRRLPIIVRVDGKSFSKLTSKLEKPFDPCFVAVMDEVAKTLCEEIQGAQLAYVQSDEVSVLVHGYKTYASQAWFDNQLQKIVSVTAAVAASTFTFNSARVFGNPRQAAFDARAFVLPESEVANYFHWRQTDAIRNSVQMLARAHFSHKQCDSKSRPELQELLLTRGVDWNALSDDLKQGRIVIKRPQRRDFLVAGETTERTIVRDAWTLDRAPIFSVARELIDDLLETEDENG